MNDRELLEKAAKAHGAIEFYPEWLYTGNAGFFCKYTDDAWNPLDDDGDALRLLTRLPFRELYVSEIGATVSWRREDGNGHGYKCDEYAQENGNDLGAATRRAIVRAAASMGEE